VLAFYIEVFSIICTFTLGLLSVSLVFCLLVGLCFECVFLLFVRLVCLFDLLCWLFVLIMVVFLCDTLIVLVCYSICMILFVCFGYLFIVAYLSSLLSGCVECDLFVVLFVYCL